MSRPVLELLVEITPDAYRAIWWETDEETGAKSVRDIAELGFDNGWKGEFAKAGRVFARFQGDAYLIKLHESHASVSFGRKRVISSQIAVLLSAGDGVDQQLEEGTVC